MAREKDTAAWLAQEYSGNDSNSLFVIRAGSPKGMQLPWPKVQRRIAQLIRRTGSIPKKNRTVLTTSTPSPSGKLWQEREVS